MAVSVMKKVERCEGIGRRGRQGEAATLHDVAGNYRVVKLKINQLRASHHHQIIPPLKLQALLHAHPAFKGISPSLAPAACTLLPHIITSLHHKDSKAPRSMPSLQLNSSLQSLHEQDQQLARLQSLPNFGDHEPSCVQHPCKPQAIVLQENSKTSSRDIPFLQPKLLQSVTLQENDEANCARSPWQLQESSNERDEETSRILEQSVQKLEEDGSSQCSLRKATEAGKEQMISGEEGREEARSPWKLQSEVEMKAGGGKWEEVKKMECECCGMEEECTGGYEEKVRERLRGHWLCGLCEEAVGEERKRVGGSMQAALVAHMQPCRCFSRSARAKVSPSPSDVAVPHAVCRLLCRHLSTPAPHRHPPSSSSFSLSLSRSSSCLPSWPNNKE